MNFLILQVDFDKTKHLCEKSIKRRQQERDRLIQMEREEAERARKEKEEEVRRKEEERLVVMDTKDGFI